MNLQTIVANPACIEAEAEKLPVVAPPTVDESGLVIFTPWSSADPNAKTQGDHDLQAARDYLYRQRVRDVLQEQAPWLVPILAAARAAIGAMPGRVYASLDDGRTLIEIPHLGAHLLLLPWAGPDEAAH